mgnify:FL=1
MINAKSDLRVQEYIPARNVFSKSDGTSKTAPKPSAVIDIAFTFSTVSSGRNLFKQLKAYL